MNTLLTAVCALALLVAQTQFTLSGENEFVNLVSTRMQNVADVLMGDAHRDGAKDGACSARERESGDNFYCGLLILDRHPYVPPRELNNSLYGAASAVAASRDGINAVADFYKAKSEVIQDLSNSIVEAWRDNRRNILKVQERVNDVEASLSTSILRACTPVFQDKLTALENRIKQLEARLPSAQ